VSRAQTGSDQRMPDEGRPADSALDPSAPMGIDGPGINDDGQPLTIRVQVRIATGGQARAVAAAQGRALRALLAALPGNSPTTPDGTTNR
jgi:hypothetical protein